MKQAQRNKQNRYANAILYIAFFVLLTHLMDIYHIHIDTAGYDAILTVYGLVVVHCLHVLWNERPKGTTTVVEIVGK